MAINGSITQYDDETVEGFGRRYFENVPRGLRM
jgi:hypothetical protein